MEEYTTGMGDVISVHDASDCEPPCVIHSPSDHAMRKFPTHWRGDRWLMERICPHGVGHPDPDDIAFKERLGGRLTAHSEAVHGCDGCCRGAVPKYYFRELGDA